MQDIYHFIPKLLDQSLKADISQNGKLISHYLFITRIVPLMAHYVLHILHVVNKLKLLNAIGVK